MPIFTPKKTNSLCTLPEKLSIQTKKTYLYFSAIEFNILITEYSCAFCHIFSAWGLLFSTQHF